MALVLSGVHSSGPGLQYELHAEQTGGSGNSRTIKLTLKLKVSGSSSASWFGYAMDHRFNVNGNWSGWSQSKGTESWNATQAFRSWTYTYTTDVGTSSEKDITVGFQTDAHHSSNSWDATKTGTFRVGKTNTAPYFTSGEQWLRLRPSSDSGTAFNGYYPENVSYLYIDWGYASDSEGGTINYSLNQSINGGGWSRVDYGTDRAHGIQIGSGNEGQKMQFYVDAVDNGGLWSGKVYSATITKNTLSGGSVSSVTSINYNSSSFEVTVGAGRNSDGSTVNYRIYSDNITIYNQNDTTGLKHTVQIYKSGNVPTTPYIRFDDIKNYLKNSSYNGRIHIGVKTTNNYGSVKWSGGSVGIDLRTNPNPASSQQISTSSSESTMYIKPAFSPNYYFLPDGSKVARVKWNLGSDKLGDAITQELYVAYGSGSWQKIADLNGSTSYYNHTISKQTSRQQFKYLIRTKTSYGYYTDAQTPAENLEYYNSPKITVGTISRTAWTAEVKITVKSDSSIPNIGTTGWWECRNTVETTLLVENPNGTLNETQNEQIIYIDPLFGENEHSLLVVYNDNTGFSIDKRQEVSIPANLPVFFVNKYGAGVNGLKADRDTALNIRGSVFPQSTIDGTVSYADTPIGLYMTKNETTSDGFPSAYFTTLGVACSENRQFQIGANNGGSTLAFRSGHVNNTGGTGNGWTPWKNIYHEGNKPKPSDIGAIPSSGGEVSGEIKFANDRGISWYINGDGGDITFHADNPSGSSYIKYNVTDDLNEYHTFGGTHWNNGWSEWLRINNSETHAKGNLRVSGSVKIGSTIPSTCDSLANDHYGNGSNSATNRPRDWCNIRSFGAADITNTRMQLAWYYGNGNEFYLRSQYDQNSSWNSWERILTTRHAEIGSTGEDSNFLFTANRNVNNTACKVHFGIFNWGSNPAGVIEVYKGNTSQQALLIQQNVLFPNNNGSCLLGQNANKWGAVWATNGSIQQSDRNDKENIQYFSYVEEHSINDPYYISTIEQSKECEKHYDFIRGINFAKWDWKENGIEGLDNIGFIAQDLAGTEIGDRILYYDEEGGYGYSVSNYVTTIAIALQHSINEVELLKSKINTLETMLGVK